MSQEVKETTILDAFGTQVQFYLMVGKVWYGASGGAKKFWFGDSKIGLNGLAGIILEKRG